MVSPNEIQKRIEASTRTVLTAKKKKMLSPQASAKALGEKLESAIASALTRSLTSAKVQDGNVEVTIKSGNTTYSLVSIEMDGQGQPKKFEVNEHDLVDFIERIVKYNLK